jgi:hypothetical protein
VARDDDSGGGPGHRSDRAEYGDGHQVTAGAPSAGTARPTTLTARLAGLAAYTADIAAAILGSPPF